MLPGNKKHVKKVLGWSAGVTLPLAAASLAFYPPLIAVSILTGALISFVNILSIVRLTEILAGAALQAGVSRAARAVATVVHLIKLVLILAILVSLVVFRLTNLFALLAGFTVVLIVNLLSGFAAFGEDEAGEEPPRSVR